MDITDMEINETSWEKKNFNKKIRDILDADSDEIDDDLSNVSDNQNVITLKDKKYKFKLKSYTKMNGIYQCDFCTLYFTSKSLFDEHLRSLHNTQPPDKNHRPPRISCPGEGCSNLYHTLIQLRKHIQEDHKVTMEKFETTFKNFDEFKAWKDKLEYETQCYYVKNCNSQKRDCFNYYYCFRSGYNDGLSGQRKMRKVGSVKMNGSCPSQIIVKSTEDKRVTLIYWKTHFGHTTEPGNISLTSNEKNKIAELAALGTSYKGLINELKGTQSVDPHKITRVRKSYHDLIKSSFECEINKEMGSAEGFSQWIQSCCQMDEMPILLCHQENIGCKSEKFILVIMTEVQKNVLASASKDILSVDTYSLVDKRYLLTVSVVDDLNAAFPVLFCISNKLCGDTMNIVLTCVKENIGVLNPTYLLSHYHSYIYASWIEVMGGDPIRLWSEWHITNAARHHLTRTVKKNTSFRCEVFNTLQVIIDCKSVEVFDSIFKNYLEKLANDNRTKTFGIWLNKNFGQDTQKWAHCYRAEFNWEINFQFSALYELFFFCNKNSRGKGMYTFTTTLLKVLRRKVLDKFSDSPERVTLAVETINDCHNNSFTIPHTQITTISEKLWSIEQPSLERVFVAQESERCPLHCSLKCLPCNICVHQFTCSCLNNLINANLCKHIHAVAFNTFGMYEEPADDANMDHDDSVESINDSITAESILAKTMKLHEAIQKHKLNEDSLARMNKYLNACINIASSGECESLVVGNAAETANSEESNTTSLFLPVVANAAENSTSEEINTANSFLPISEIPDNTAYYVPDQDKNGISNEKVYVVLLNNQKNASKKSKTKK